VGGGAFLVRHKRTGFSRGPPGDRGRGRGGKGGFEKIGTCWEPERERGRTAEKSQPKSWVGWVKKKKGAGEKGPDCTAVFSRNKLSAGERVGGPLKDIMSKGVGQ